MNWAKGVPDGLLVFFPSYTVLAACMDFWKSGASSGAGTDTVWDRITRTKLAVIEPRVRKICTQMVETAIPRYSLQDTVWHRITRTKLAVIEPQCATSRTQMPKQPCRTEHPRTML